MSVGEEDSDPIIKEIPVYASRTLKDQLYLFQYPIRPASSPYAQSSIFASKIKPVQGRVELSVALNPSAPDYDHSKGEQIALNVDGASTSGGERDFPNGLMDRQTLTSTRAISRCSRYALGVLNKGEIHLTSIKDILVLRPDLSYLDKGDKTAKSEGRVPTLPEDQEAENEDAEDDIKPVTVKFAKTDSETVKKMREKTYNYQVNKANMESWIPVNYHPASSKESAQEFEQLYCKKLDEEVFIASESNKYLQSLKNSL